MCSLRRLKKTQSSQADGKVTGKMEAEKQKGPGLKKKVEKSKNPKYTKRTEIFTGGNCVRYI